MAPTPSEALSPSECLKEGRAGLAARTDLVGAGLRAALGELHTDWLSDGLGAVEGVALLAVGGYGRGDPSFGSDLDLVLVHRPEASVAAAAAADRLWYPIWDAGVGLDHAVRTVPEALDVAEGNLEAALGLLDARHVAGDPALSAELRERAYQRWRAASRRRLPELAEVAAQRAERHGDVAFLLEPSLKDGRGGLRDVHAMHALAATWLVVAPAANVRASYDVLLDVRGELHRRQALSGQRRFSDVLVMQEHSPIAARLGYADADALRIAVSRAARTISYAAAEAFRRAERSLRPARRFARPPARRPLAADVVEHDGEVVLARGADPAHDHALVLRVAAAAAQTDLPISEHTLDRLAAEAAAPARPWDEQTLRPFLALLGAGEPLPAVVDALDHHGLLATLLPEWERVRGLPQHNPVHRFTVDRHLVETAVRAAALTRRVRRPDLLLLGALLHDIGKGLSGDHSGEGVAIVEALGPDLGLPPGDVATLATLVRHHLLLADVATRRDLADPATVRHVAAAVGDSETLGLLHALTEADALATGPAAWSEWKARLVGELVQRVAATLDGAGPGLQPMRMITPEVAVAPDDVLLDVRQGAGAAYLVTVTAQDRRGLLAACAGVFALHRLEVLAADASYSGEVACTTFTVSASYGGPPDWTRVRIDVRRALDGSLRLEERLTERERAYAVRRRRAAPPEVRLDETASDSATVVEVRAHDRAGLLYRVARSLAEAGLDIRTAHVSTLGAEAVDAFYVVDGQGRPRLDEPAKDAVRKAVLAAAGG